MMIFTHIFASEMHQVLQNIRNIRKLKGYSQEYMAERLELTQSTYSRFEKGNKKIDLLLVHQIAKVLEMEIEQVFIFHKVSGMEYQEKGRTISAREESESYQKQEDQYKQQIEELKEKIAFRERLIDTLNRQLKDKEEIIELLKKRK